MESRFMMLRSVFCCGDAFADLQLDLANRPPLFLPSLLCLCSAGAFYSLPGMSPQQDRSQCCWGVFEETWPQEDQATS